MSDQGLTLCNGNPSRFRDSDAIATRKVELQRNNRFFIFTGFRSLLLKVYCVINLLLVIFIITKLLGHFIYSLSLIKYCFLLANILF